MVYFELLQICFGLQNIQGKFEIFIVFTTNPVGKFETLMAAITNFFLLLGFGKNIPVMFQLLHDHIIVESGMTV